MSDLMPSPDDFVGAYRIVRPIGKGGMGAVFEAVHTRTGKPAAIKVLHARFTEDTEALSRFLAEGRATAKLDHPSIVRILETGQLPSGACYIAMEYLHGETLGKRLKREGRLGREALRIGAQIAAALVQAHQKNIIHRDLKPSNLILLAGDADGTGRDEVKIIDFGIAKIAGDDKEAGDFRTRTGTMIGTPVYMSPEQCRGVAVTERTDVYALGVILYQALAGKPPFYSRADGDILAMHIMVAPRPLRELEPAVPQRVADFIARMLAKSAADRPNMATVATELVQLLDDPEWESPAPAPAPTPVAAATAPSAESPIEEPPSLPEVPLPAVVVGPPPVVGLAPGAALVPGVGLPLSAALAPVAGSHLAAAPVPMVGSPLSTPASAALAPVTGQSAAFTAAVQPLARRRTLLWAAAGLAGVVLVGGLAVRSAVHTPASKAYRVDSSGPETVPKALPVVPTPVVTPEPATVRWAVRSQPAGATVLSESGERLGETPLMYTSARSIGTQTIIVRLPGYRDAQLSMSRGSDEDREAELVPSPPLPGPPPGLGPVKNGPRGGKNPSKRGGKRAGQGKRTADDTTILLDFKTKKVLKTQ